MDRLNWQRICDVEPGPLTAWLASASWQQHWNGIARVFEVASYLAQPVIAAVLDHFRPGHPACRMDGLQLNRIEPGWFHPLHVDGQAWGNWLTRVHVPLITNPGCWHLFESEGVRFHMEVGGAYSFDTEARHSFGNDGDTPRIHLLFDVYQR